MEGRDWIGVHCENWETLRSPKFETDLKAMKLDPAREAMNPTAPENLGATARIEKGREPKKAARNESGEKWFCWFYKPKHTETLLAVFCFGSSALS